MHEGYIAENKTFCFLASDRVCRALSCLKCSQHLMLAFQPVCNMRFYTLCTGLLSVTLSVALRPPVFHWYPLL